jgi:hypothetical protein
LASKNPNYKLYQTKDFALSMDGDLILGADGDLLTITGPATLQQEIVFRLKTKQGDYLYFPQCGASLEDLVGLPNSEDTANEGVYLIQNALTHDGLIPVEALTVTAYPMDEQTIVFQILVDLSYFAYENEYLSLQISLSLLEGLIL